MDNQANKVLSNMAAKLANAELQLSISQANVEILQEKLTGAQQELSKYKKEDEPNGKND